MRKAIYSMCSEGDKDYFCILSLGSKIRFYENKELKHERMISKETPVSSIVYKKDKIVHTKEGKGELYVHNIKTGNLISKHTFDQYDKVFVLKYVNNAEKIFFRACKGRDEYFILYDLENEGIIFELDMEGEFFDFSIFPDGSYVLLCRCEKDVSVYEDDEDSKTTHLLHFRCKDSGVEELDKLEVYSEYDNFDDRYRSFIIPTGGVRFPLFDQYMYYWPSEKSITASGKYAVYYQEDIKGLIISDVLTADIYKILTLPEAYGEEDIYYYNEETGILSILSGSSVTQYLLTERNTNYIERLNRLYNEAYKTGKNLQKDFDFKRVVFANIENTICERK